MNRVEHQKSIKTYEFENCETVGIRGKTRARGPQGTSGKHPGAGAPGAFQERALGQGPLGPDPVSGFHNKKKTYAMAKGPSTYYVILFTVKRFT